MITKRIIPCLDVKDERVVKGTNFIDLIDAGSVYELAERYSKEGADELVFLDITATEEKRKTVVNLVREVSKVVRIPFTVGGGIRTLKDIEAMLNEGADKVSLNSAIVNNPQLISDAAKRFGSQAVVAAIDIKSYNSDYYIHTIGGKTPTEIEAHGWCKKVQELGAGEILLTSMDHDGTKNGFNNFFMQKIAKDISIPVIASGGAGTLEHFYDAFAIGKADACLAASLFHFNKMTISDLKTFLYKKGIPVRR